MTESSVAELLARKLLDENLWSVGEMPSDHAVERERLAAEALALYEVTAPLYAERVVLSWNPFDTAIYVLRMMIGDRSAILSQEWEPKTLRRFANIPTRPAVERWIDRGKVADWAAEHGHPLNLVTTPATDDGLVRRVWRARTSRRGMALEFCSLDEQYETIQTLREKWPVWVTRRPTLKRAAAGLIAAGHNNLLIFGEADDRGAYVVAIATLMLAQGIFVATHAERELTDFFPTRPYLRQLLHETDGYQWLTRHGRDLPHWLK